jgi:hypothetical protein
MKSGSDENRQRLTCFPKWHRSTPFSYLPFPKGPTMSTNALNDFDSVAALWRYPVKSMMGEELNSATVGKRGILGDRAFALIDDESGQVVSAKPQEVAGPLLFPCRLR